jgi:predicted Rossmann fold nucleotide-binding protein DprA/Smf involved in DNA uptake
VKKLSERMDAAMEVMDGERVRWLLGKKLSITQDQNVFGKTISENRYDLILSNAAEAELFRRLITGEITDEPKTTVEIAESLEMDPAEVLRHLIAMRKWRMVEEAGSKDGYLLFRALAPRED